MFNKIFPSKVEGEAIVKESTESVEMAIDKISNGHYTKKDDGEITVIPKGAFNFLGISHPIRNYRKIIFRLTSLGENGTKINYEVFRKLAKASSVIYMIFLIIDIALIVGTVMSIASMSEYAPVLLMATVFWLIVSSLAFVFDYFVLLSKGAVLRGFNKNIIKRIVSMAKAADNKAKQ